MWQIQENLNYIILVVGQEGSALVFMNVKMEWCYDAGHIHTRINQAMDNQTQKILPNLALCVGYYPKDNQWSERNRK